MARKTATVTINDEGRDKGKVFVLREVPASQAEDWALRAFLAIAKGGIEIPDAIASAGLAGVAKMGPSAFKGMPYEDARPLLSEMMDCITIRPEPAKPFERTLVETDIEEVATRLKLRMRLFDLHVGFLGDAGP